MKACIIVASGLHLGYVGCYGNDWIATPALDRLAAQSVLFDRHYADQPELGKARFCWRTGRYSLPLPNQTATATGETPPDLFALLSRQGIRTELISEHSDCLATERAAGWNKVHHISTTAAALDKLEQTIDAALDLLDQLARADDWLLQIELATLLPPWNVPERHRAAYALEPADEEEESQQPASEPQAAEDADDAAFLEWQRDYAAAVTYVDAGLAPLLAGLDDRYRDALVLVTSDCGQSFEEPREPVGADVSLRLCEELIHIPLILRLPDEAQAGRRIAALTQPVDLLPTLFDFFRLLAPESHGSSLLPLARGDMKQIRSYGCAGLRASDSVEWILRTDAWTLFLPVYPVGSEGPKKPALYVKPDDRWDVNDVRQHYLELAERLELVLRGFVDATRRPGPLCPPELGDLDVVLAGDKPTEDAPSSVAPM